MLLAFALSATYIWMAVAVALASLVGFYLLYRVDDKIERRREKVSELATWLEQHHLELAAKPLKKYSVGDYDGALEASVEAYNKLDTEPERKAHFQAIGLKLIGKLMHEDSDYAQKVLDEAEKFRVILKNKREAEAEIKELEDARELAKAQKAVAAAKPAEPAAAVAKA